MCAQHTSQSGLYALHITPTSRISKQCTHFLSVFLPQTFHRNVDPARLIFYSPFCLPSLQCNADFLLGGGMVELGGVPWIIVEDIFTLTHFGVPFAPLKGAAALLCLKSTEAVEISTKTTWTNPQVRCVESWQLSEKCLTCIPKRALARSTLV